MAHTGYRETIYIGPPPPRPSNSLGLAGFLISLFSIPLCGILAPLGLLLSVFALRKSPRGFAVAGTMLGLLGTLWVGGLFLRTAHDHHRRDVRQKTNVTRVQLENAKNLIVEHQIETGAVPEGIEGNKMVLHLKDGWDKPIRYDVDADSYVLRSAGPDDEWETRDDIVKR